MYVFIHLNVNILNYSYHKLFRNTPINNKNRNKTTKKGYVILYIYIYIYIFI